MYCPARSAPDSICRGDRAKQSCASTAQAKQPDYTAMSSEEKTAEHLSREIAELFEQVRETNAISAKLIANEFNLRDAWPSLESTLMHSGWFPERKIDMSDLLGDHKVPGITVNAYATEFLEAFGCLDIAFPLDDEDETYTYTFSLVTTMQTYSMARLRRHEQTVKASLCPIGLSEDKLVVLLISQSGKVYASVDGNLKCVADSYQEALNKLNSGEKFTKEARG